VRGGEGKALQAFPPSNSRHAASEGPTSLSLRRMRHWSRVVSCAASRNAPLAGSDEGANWTDCYAIAAGTAQRDFDFAAPAWAARVFPADRQ
jgi:hypothetical protein